MKWTNLLFVVEALLALLLVQATSLAAALNRPPVGESSPASSGGSSGAAAASGTSEEAAAAAGGRFVVPLHRQRVPVKSDTDTVSYKSVYFGHISVGGPKAQGFTVVFDTGSGHVVLPSRWCRSETCLVHNRFDPAQSSTAVDVEHDGTRVEPGAARDQITVAYGTGEITGQFVSDRLCLGEPHTVENDEAAAANASSPQKQQPCIDLRLVMATEMTHEPFHAFAFDGVLGLGMDSLALAPEFSFFGMMTKQRQLEQPSFGVFLAESDEEVSEISFGGHAPEHLKTGLSWAPVAMPELGYWQVKITKLRLGNQTLDFCDDGQCRAVVDTGTSLLAVPRAFAEAYQAPLEEAVVSPPAAKDGSLNCKLAQGLELFFEVDGATLELHAGDYSRASMQLRDEHDDSWSSLEPSSPSDAATTDEEEEQATDSSSTAAPPSSRCRATMMPLDLPEPLGPKLFIWGEPVLRKYYTVYNWKEQSIGFALAKHASDRKAAPPRKKTDEDEAGSKPKVQRKPLLL